MNESLQSIDQGSVQPWTTLPTWLLTTLQTKSEGTVFCPNSRVRLGDSLETICDGNNSEPLMVLKMHSVTQLICSRST